MCVVYIHILYSISQKMDPETKTKLSKYLVKPIIYGAAGAIATALVTGETNFYVDVFGRPVNALLFIGGACGASSIISDVAGDYILPLIPGNEHFTKTETSLINLGLNGLSTYGILVLTGTADVSNLLVPIGVGAASAVVGEYIHQNYAEPWLMSL